MTQAAIGNHEGAVGALREPGRRAGGVGGPVIARQIGGMAIDQLNFDSAELLAALQAAFDGLAFPQGMGLRPQPWAPLCRPVRPVLLETLGGFD